MRVHDVLALDGEGITVDERHLYTLLVCYDSYRDVVRSLDDWHDGLSTDRILSFLVRLRKRGNTIACMYFGNYDVTMWLRDLTFQEKEALWSSGWVLWRGSRSGVQYFIRWIPRKMFFVGEWDGSCQISPEKLTVYNYPDAARKMLIYDVSGFAQTSFVAALEGAGIGDTATIAAMKERRHEFTRDQADDITAYCQEECYYLARWVQNLDANFQREGIVLASWHGGGALASYFLRKNKVASFLADPDDPDLRAAIMGAYFGGRSEIFQQGYIRDQIYDYDINSAYPYACLFLPNLVDGSWEYVHGGVYGKVHGDVPSSTPSPWSLWQVRFDLRSNRKNGIPIGPIPFRWKRGIYFPNAVGSCWVHYCELQNIYRYYVGANVDVLGGWIYHPADPTFRPFSFVRELAARRVALKNQGDYRATAYKYGLNSIYGKLAQRQTDPDKKPPFQCYYAAGFVTALTRARLLRFVLDDGRYTPWSLDDLVMTATDGVFCRRSRQWNVGESLGQFSLAGTLPATLFLQPGTWYSSDGKARTRGYDRRSLDYQSALDQWRASGPRSRYEFTETRFYGIGYAVGTRDDGSCGIWRTATRFLCAYPERKFIEKESDKLESYRLSPFDMTGLASEPYVPAPPSSPELALALFFDQPDMVD